MDPVESIALWAALFIGSHLLISSSLVRPRLIAAVGDQRYRAIYSIVSFGTLIPLIVVFAHHKHSGPMLWYERNDGSIRGIVFVMMLIAFVFLVSGLVTPSPASMGAPAGGVQPPHGMLKVTRHPSFVGFVLFGLAHILVNAWVGDVIFFGTFPVLGVLGGWHQDARKLSQLGKDYRAFMAVTSFFPGFALFSRRQQWESSDMPWMAIAVGAALTIIVVFVHPWLFGGQPIRLQ
ncbi:MAG: NnrU family protein [Candidatus Binataceae bacterium]